MKQEIIPGKPLNKSLSTNLKNYTGHTDRVEVSNETGISVSTIRDVIYQGNPVTKKNLIAVIGMIRAAKRNIQKAKEAEVIFEEIEIIV